MKAFFPLYAKIVLWFLLSLTLLVAAFLLIFWAQTPLGFDWMLATGADARIQPVSDVIVSELNRNPRDGWNEVLGRFSAAYKIQFFIFHNDGTQAAGKVLELPPELLKQLRPGVTETLPRLPDDGQRPGARQPRPPPPPEHEVRPFPKVMVRTSNPTRYWVIVRAPIHDPAGPEFPPRSLVMMSHSLSGNGLFFDYQRWLAVGLGAVIFSALLWLPFVRSITRSVAQMTQTAEQIAEGRFDSRIDDSRSDELGRLGQAINSMTARLSGFVSGQRRFLGDIAHELCSPIARIQLTLGLLEQNADEKHRSRVEGLREEVQQMADLVNELLSFSKAALSPKQAPLESVELRDLALRVIAREAPDLPLEIEIDGGLRVSAVPNLLERALANVIRNALRYAGQDGTIRIYSRAGPKSVLLTVADSGPGLPEDVLDRIMDPFFRPESSRSREFGGVGLGLAIVRTCVEACQGSVTIRNRQPSGLQVEFRLLPGASHPA